MSNADHMTRDNVYIHRDPAGFVSDRLATIDRGGPVSPEAWEALRADLRAWTWLALPSALRAIRKAAKAGAVTVDAYRAAIRRAPGRQMTAEDIEAAEARVQVAVAGRVAATRAHLATCRVIRCKVCG